MAELSRREVLARAGLVAGALALGAQPEPAEAAPDLRDWGAVRSQFGLDRSRIHLTSFLLATYFFIAGRAGNAPAAHVSLIITVAVTTIAWIGASLLTPPADRARLIEFYRLVRPAGPGWTGIREESGVGSSPDSMAHALLGWVLGCAFVYAALFGSGSFLYGHIAQGMFWAVAFVASGSWLVQLLRR